LAAVAREVNKLPERLCGQEGTAGEPSPECLQKIIEEIDYQI
jgi:hypothetical protein